MVKKEFKNIELNGGGDLNLMLIRDTQSSGKGYSHGYRRVFFLDFWFQRCSGL